MEKTRKRRQMPSLTGLRAFDALCREGSVSKAAIFLGVTAGAVSRQIQQLETELNCDLFSRSGGRLLLTPQGEKYKIDIQKSFDLIENATVRITSRQKSDRLVISCSPSFHFCWLLNRLPSFESQNQQTEVVVHTELSTHAQAPEVDASIGVGEWPANTQLIQTKFMTNYSGPIISAALADNINSAAGEAPFSQIRQLTLRKQPEIWHDWYQVSGKKPATSPLTAELDHMFLTIEAAKAGLGAAIAPYGYVAKDINAGKLIAPFGFLERSVPYYIAWQASMAPKPALKSFIAWLKAEGSKTPAPKNTN